MVSLRSDNCRKRIVRIGRLIFRGNHRIEGDQAFCALGLEKGFVAGRLDPGVINRYLLDMAIARATAQLPGVITDADNQRLLDEYMQSLQT